MMKYLFEIFVILQKYCVSLQSKMVSNKNDVIMNIEELKRRAGWTYSVYVLTFPDGKKYVGCTHRDVEERWSGGWGYKENRDMFRDIVRYGWENIVKDVVVAGVSEKMARRTESRIIKEISSDKPSNGYNNRNDFRDDGGNEYIMSCCDGNSYVVRFGKDVNVADLRRVSLNGVCYCVSSISDGVIFVDVCGELAFDVCECDGVRIEDVKIGRKKKKDDLLGVFKPFHSKDALLDICRRLAGKYPPYTDNNIHICEVIEACKKTNNRVSEQSLRVQISRMTKDGILIKTDIRGKYLLNPKYK